MEPAKGAKTETPASLKIDAVSEVPFPRIAPPPASKKIKIPRVENGGDYEITMTECEARHEFDDIIKKGICPQ